LRAEKAAKLRLFEMDRRSDQPDSYHIMLAGEHPPASAKDFYAGAIFGTLWS
jgi:hypothetical protein